MELLRNNNLSFEDLYADEALYDQLLVQSTKLTFLKKRIPGKYVYDAKLGEETVEEFEKACEADYQKKLKKLFELGYNFPEEQMQAMIEFYRKYVYTGKGGLEQFKRWNIDNLESSQLKQKLSYLKLGVNKTSKRFSGFGSIWGTEPNSIVFHEFMSIDAYNRNYSYFLGKVRDLIHDPL